MTTEEVKHILKNHEDRVSVCVALSFVNLSDNELNVLVMRYMRGLTQEQTAESMGEAVSKNTVFNIQQAALKKTAKMWSKLSIAKALMETP